MDGLSPAAEVYLRHIRITWGLRLLLAWRMLTRPELACATICEIAQEKIDAARLKGEE